MSDLFAMTDGAADAKLASAADNSIDSLSELEAPWYRGLGRGPGLGLMRGFAKVADTLGITVGGTAGQAIDKSREVLDTGAAAADASGNILGAIFGGHPQTLATGVPAPEESHHTEAQDALFSATDEVGGNAVDYWTPKANEVGRVGQVLGGLGEAGSELVAGLGSPYALVAANTAEGGKDLVKQGVDAKTAGAAAALEGAVSYAGLKVPIAGSTLTSRIATGAAGNVALGSGSRFLEKKLLESQGYADQAKPFTTDLAAVSTDALLGVLFGVTHHTLAPRISPKLTPAQADAILAARNAKNFREATSPGVPADIRADAANQDAAELTLEQLSRGEPVDVGPVVARNEGAQFTPDGRIEASAELAAQVEEQAAKDVSRVTEPAAPAESVQSPAADAGADYSVTEGELTDEQLAHFQGLRSDVPTDQVVRGPGEGAPGESGNPSDGRARGETFQVFRGIAKPGEGVKRIEGGVGEYYTDNAEDARNYAGKNGEVVAKSITLKNPYRTSLIDGSHITAKRAAELRAAGFDSVIGESNGVREFVLLPEASGGEPLRVFRGASRELSPKDFRPEALGFATEHPSSGLGVFFTNTADHAANYGAVSEHYLDIRNPKVIRVEDFPGLDSLAEYRQFAKELRAEGHDGVVIDASHLGGPVNYVAFRHEQVKAAGKSSASADARLQDPETRAQLEGLRSSIGLAERGGRLTRDADGNVTGRTPHVGEPIWMNRPGASEGNGITAKSALAALDRLKQNRPLGTKQQEFVQYALNELEHAKRATEDFVNEQAAAAKTENADTAAILESPEIASLRELATERPDASVYMGFDADGQPVKTTVAEAYAQIQRELEREMKDTKAYEAAVTCFLGHGA